MNDLETVFDDSFSFQASAVCRPKKGKSLITFPKDYVIVDVETTGLDFTDCDIIEISCLRVVNGEMKDNYTSFIHREWPLPTFITELTGITDEMLKDAPSLADVMQRTKDFIVDNIIVGHNANFDVNFIYDHMMQSIHCPLTNDFVDTLRLCRRMLPELHHHRLSDMVEYFNIPTSTAHRALADCETTYHLFYKLFEIASSEGDAEAYLEKFRHSHKTQDYLKRLSEIKATTEDFDISNPLYGKTVVFTGELSRFPRAQAMQIVANIGGINGTSVTKDTNFLVIGTQDLRKTNGEKSAKQIKAEKYIAKGCDLQIMPEDVFYSLITEE